MYFLLFESENLTEIKVPQDPWAVINPVSVNRPQPVLSQV